MKNLFVSDLKTGTTLTGATFALFEVKSARDKNERPYYDLVLGDKTGQVKAKIWSDQFDSVDKAALRQGRVVAVDASVAEYKGQPQLTILSLKGVDETKLDSYTQSSTYDPDEMMSELEAIIGKISNPGVKGLFANLLADAEAVQKLKYWPAGISYHHDFRSGLLQHILECLALADGMERFYPDADFDLVRAGIILHDIGKLEEMDASGLVPRYTVKGSVLGHIYIGCEFVDRYLPKDAPEKLGWNLKHIILSHHGEKEKGSPVLPVTTEAMLVSTIDDTSAKARMMDKGVKEPADEHGMTSYNRWLQRWMWADNKLESVLPAE